MHEGLFVGNGPTILEHLLAGHVAFVAVLLTLSAQRDGSPDQGGKRPAE